MAAGTESVEVAAGIESAKDIKAETVSFWEDFQLFPTRVEQIVFSNNWLLVAIVLTPFILRLAISLTADMRAVPIPLYGEDKFFTELNSQTPWAWTQDSLDQWILLLATIGILPALWAYRRWMQKVPDFFQWLLQKDKIYIENGDIEGRYLQYLRDYQRALFARKGRLSFLIAFVSILIIWHLAGGRPEWVGQRMESLRLDCSLYDGAELCAPFRVEVFRDLIPYGLGYLIWVVPFAYAAWALYATGRQVKLLTDDFDIRIHPSHADKCGGLSPIGDFCFDMVLPLVAGFIIVALMALIAALLQTLGSSLQVGAVTFQVPWITVWVITSAALLVLTPLVAFGFFSPLSGIHQYMAARKRESEDAYANKVSELEYQAQILIEDKKSAALAKEQMETLQVIKRGRLDYRAWPFRRGIVLGLFSPQIALTTVSLLNGLKKLFEL